MIYFVGLCFPDLRVFWDEYLPKQLIFSLQKPEKFTML